MRVLKSFYGACETPSQNRTVRAVCSTEDQIVIEIKGEGLSDAYVALDVPTAIQLAKQLRTEINLAKDIS